MRRARATAGYTLLELIVALSMSTIVLVGIFSIMSTMMQYELDGLRKGSVNGWSLSSLVAMNREIEGASVLAYPTSGGGGDSLIVCANWSRLVGASGGVLNGGSGTVYYYCFDSTNNVLRRKSASGACPASPATPPSCDATTYGAGNVVATGVYRSGAANVFTADPSMAGTVRLQYVVGNPSQTTQTPNPQTLAFDTRVTLDRQYGNARD